MFIYFISQRFCLLGLMCQLTEPTTTATKTHVEPSGCCVCVFGLITADLCTVREQELQLIARPKAAELINRPEEGGGGGHCV